MPGMVNSPPPPSRCAACGQVAQLGDGKRCHQCIATGQQAAADGGEKAE